MSERQWNELRAHLGQRARAHGWYLDEDEMGWCYGLGGACRLAVSVRGDRIVLYDADHDTETVVRRRRPARRIRCPTLERSHRGFSPAYRKILDSDLHLDTSQLAEHQRQLAAQDAALDTGDRAAVAPTGPARSVPLACDARVPGDGGGRNADAEFPC